MEGENGTVHAREYFLYPFQEIVEDGLQGSSFIGVQFQYLLFQGPVT